MIGDIVGNVANIIAGLFQSLRKGLSFKMIKRKEMVIVAREQLDFPKYQALPALLTTISISLPVIIVTKHFGLLETSYFDLTRMVLLVPSALVAGAVSQVLFQNISERINRKEQLSGLVLKTSAMLFLIALCVIVIMLIAGPYLFGLVFDEQYIISGQYAKVLSVAFMIQFIAAPVSISLTALKKLKVIAVWQVLYFLLLVSLLYIDFNSVKIFFLAFMMINLVAYSIYWILTFTYVRKYDREITFKQ